MTITSKDMAAVARTLELIEKSPPTDESWDTAQRDGPNLQTRLRSWLKEQI